MLRAPRGVTHFFFQWEGRLFKIPTGDSGDSSNKAMVFDPSQKNFTKSDSSIARLHNFLRDKENFVIANIKEKGTVLLFTQQTEMKNNKKLLNLWITDGTRVVTCWDRYSRIYRKSLRVSFVHKQ